MFNQSVLPNRMNTSFVPGMRFSDIDNISIQVQLHVSYF